MMNKIAISCLLLACLHMISVEARNLPSSTYSDYSSPDTYSDYSSPDSYSTYISSDSSGKGKGKGSKKSTSISSSRRSRLSKSGKGKGGKGKGGTRGSKRDSSITRPSGNTRPTGTTRKSAGGGTPTVAPTPAGGGTPTVAPTPAGGGTPTAAPIRTCGTPPTAAATDPALIPGTKNFDDLLCEDEQIGTYQGLIFTELMTSQTNDPAPSGTQAAVPTDTVTSIESADGSTTFTLERLEIAGSGDASPLEIIGYDANGDRTGSIFLSGFKKAYQIYELTGFPELANVQKLEFIWPVAIASGMDNLEFS
eukprot:scaffold1040_cov112-Cylindrotheca_fusiformis.AAC.1